MSSFLKSPLIELGFYWHTAPEVESYRKVLGWLAEHGHNRVGKVHAIRSQDGGLPRFSMDATISIELPSVETAEFEDWSIEQAIQSNQWLPISIRLFPTHKNDPEIDLRYALMTRPSFDAGEPHAIEITVGGWEVEQVLQSTESARYSKVSAKGNRTAKWVARTFRAICDDLAPDYAGNLWESSVVPPSSFVSAGYPRECWDLYLSDVLLTRPGKTPDLPPLATWTVERFNHGVFLQPRDRLNEDKSATGAKHIRDLILRHFRVEPKSGPDLIPKWHLDILGNRT